MQDSDGNQIRTVNRIGGGVCVVIEPAALGFRTSVDLDHDQAERLIAELQARPGRNR